ncbi:Shedu immune nuclease family protein [Marivirga arenosa]|uniref:Shedu immune nuclease family protein n=1 Tax=Marivirga arenosa TaxID=3059076 RepID=A0AA51X3X9_9BACT|nr:Shedu immune nuclease family protein [Marivirga sp. BKB1-2]WNB17057.1 Shedu immune nuclease family protein [Marivirga sp. BKB1-2]
MNIEITINNNKIYLEYTPENGTEWINELFEKGEDFRAKGTFRLTEDDLVKDSNLIPGTSLSLSFGHSMTFEIGRLSDDYYRIYNTILETKNDVLFHKSCTISNKYFIVNSNISILFKFEKLADQQIIIGGDKESAIPEQVFKDIINSFPSRTELKHYVNSRITNVLSQYLDNVNDSGKAFEKYIENRNRIGNIRSFPSLNEYEYEKYQFILKTLKEMLDNSDIYSESDWQNQILDIILILFPKYILCFSEVHIKDYYSKPDKSTNRKIDLMLIDANGNIDVIEIKKPFENCIVTKKTYRDNYTPMKELSGTIMQLEKYIFHLNKWGINGEKTLTKKYKNELPQDFNLKITNPKGLIIIGRDDNLSTDQLFDLEIIKRKYANVVEVITYDDLIKRLENTLDKFK